MSSHIPSPPSSSASSSPASGPSFLAVLPSRQRCTSSDVGFPEPKRSRYCNVSYGSARVDASAGQGGVNYSSHIPTPATTPAFRSFHAYEDATSARQPVGHRPFIARTSSFPLATSRSRSSITIVPCPVPVVEEAQTAEDVKVIEDTNRNPERRAGRRATESHVTFVPQPSTKESLVAGLVGASVLAIESIWGSPSAPSTTTPAVSEAAILPLRFFVTEVLRRSRTSCSTLQVALYYLHKARREIREAVSLASVNKRPIVASTYPSPPLSPIDRASARHPYESNDSVAIEQDDEEEENSPVLCGRRMFLASLIAASKFLQDRNYSNRAWAKISGLPIASINANERVFLGLIDFQLHVGAREFAKWTERLAAISSVEMQRTCASIGTQRAVISSSPSTTLVVNVEQATPCTVGHNVDIPVTGCPADASSFTTRVGKAAVEIASLQLPSPADSSDESGGRQRHVRALPRRPLSRGAMLVD